MRPLSIEQAMAHPCRDCGHDQAAHVLFYEDPDCADCLTAALDGTAPGEQRWHVYSAAELPAWAESVFVVPLYGYADRLAWYRVHLTEQQRVSSRDVERNALP